MPMSRAFVRERMLAATCEECGLSKKPRDTVLYSGMDGRCVELYPVSVVSF